MCFPCGLSDNVKPCSRCSNSQAGSSGSTGAGAGWRRTDFTGGTLPAWDFRPATTLKLDLEMQGCTGFNLWIFLYCSFLLLACVWSLGDAVVFIGLCCFAWSLMSLKLVAIKANFSNSFYFAFFFYEQISALLAFIEIFLFGFYKLIPLIL